jgi:AmiR/NasT family two-component response regulator
VIGESKLEEQLQKAVTRANKTKQLDADSKDLKKEIDEAEKAEAS